jgi:hypothetical protein
VEEKREIVRVDMENIDGKPIPKGEKFHYGKVVNTVIHTTGMVGELLHVEMWEDDAIGAGHSDENRYNKVQEQLVFVGEKGVAEVRFVISNAYRKIATAHNAYEGKTHEYYIIAYANERPITASGNINIYAPEYKEEKKKVIVEKIKGIAPVGVQEPKQKIKAEAPKVIVPKVPHVPGTKRAAPPKPVVPKPGEPKKITYIFFTDDKNHKIVNAKYGDTIRAHIGSTGLIDHKVKIKAYDHEVMGENHFLGEVGNYTISANLCHVDIVLTKQMQEKGGNFWYDEVYVDIEIMETKSHVKSTKIEVKTNSFKPDIPNNVTKLKVGKTDAEKKESSCVCKVNDLIWGNKVSCDFRKKVVEISTNLGLPQEKNEGANWLMAVMALETGRSFSPTCGTFKGHNNDDKIGYVGLIQIGMDAAIDLKVKRSELIKLNATAQLGYVEKFFKQSKFKDKLKTKTDLYLAVNYPNACGHGTEKDYVVYDSKKAAYDDNPMFKKEKDEYWFDKKGKKHFYTGKTGSSYVWEFEEAINDFYNEGIKEKVSFFGTCPVILKGTTDKEIVTYHIYNDGKIEKIIPKSIKAGYENKYKYVYHDKNKNEHQICFLDWYKTKEKEVGIVHSSIPKHSEILTDENVSDGSTSRRVKYKNDDIAEYGKHPTKGLIWRLYKSTGNDIELIKMPANLNYSKDGVVIKYGFSQTKRRYTGPNVFAAFIGALAECSNPEGITTTGSCFKEASCFPSAEHVNGRSVDIIYYKDIEKDQAFVNAVLKFKFTEVLVGDDKYCKKIKNASDGGSLHNSHLHSGNYNDSNLTIIKS